MQTLNRKLKLRQSATYSPNNEREQQLSGEKQLCEFISATIKKNKSKFPGLIFFLTCKYFCIITG